MNQLMQTNTLWISPAEGNINAVDPMTEEASTQQVINLRGRSLHDTQSSSHPMQPQVQQQSSAHPRHVTSRFGTSQCLQMQTLVAHAEGHPAAPTQKTTLSGRKSQHSASEGTSKDDAAHHGVEQIQTQATDYLLAQIAPHPGPQTKCEQCMPRDLVCDGDQENGRACTACAKRKAPCSFILRNYSCQLCPRSYASESSLKRHSTRSHKTTMHQRRSILPALNESAPIISNATSSTQLGTLSEKPVAPHDTSRHSTRASQSPQRQSPEHGNILTNQALSIDGSSQMEISQPLASEQEVEEFSPQIGFDLEAAGNISYVIQQDALYQPDSPAFEAANNSAVSYPRQSLPVQQMPTETSTVSRSHGITKLHGISQAQDTRSIGPAQGNISLAPHRVQCADVSVPGPKMKAHIYVQFPNRVMSDNHVKNKLGVIRDEIKLYEEFTRGADYHYTERDVEEEFKFLKGVRPFVSMNEVREEPSNFFASQPSRLVVLWRTMFDIHPTAILHDELVRLDLEGLELPVIIRGSLGYILLRTIFDETDQLRSTERRARLESVQQLYGAKFAAESIKHDQLFINEDKGVERQLRRPARELAERQFYELCYPLTHWDMRNPTTEMKEIHVRKLTDIALKCLRLSRELQARITEEYQYFWPRPGEVFNQDDHQDVDISQPRPQGGRIIKWTLMFGVKAQRDGQQQQLVYAKAVVITMED